MIEARQGANVVMRGLVLDAPKKPAGSTSYVEMEEMGGVAETNAREAAEPEGSPSADPKNLSRKASQDSDEEYEVVPVKIKKSRA